MDEVIEIKDEPTDDGGARAYVADDTYDANYKQVRSGYGVKRQRRPPGARAYPHCERPCPNGEACTWLHPGVHTMAGTRYQLKKITGVPGTPDTPDAGKEASIPDPPSHLKEGQAKIPCSFYSKVGACRKGDSCPHLHLPFNTSTQETPVVMEDDITVKVTQPVQTSVPKDRRKVYPCKFYLEERGCDKGDNCKYLHPGDLKDPSLDPTGGCQKGPACPYLHPRQNTPGGVKRAVKGPPINQPLSNAGPKQDCKWFLRTGMCKFGKMRRCEFNHPKGPRDATLVIKNLFQHPDLKDGLLDKETRFDVRNLWNAYCVFYYALLQRLSSVGKVLMFKCSCNVATYMRGSVFVMYATHEEALRALETFNGEMHGDREMDIELVPLTDWESAVCRRTYLEKKPHDETTCSLIHVFPNPNNAFPLRIGALCQNFAALGWCPADAGCRTVCDHPVPLDSNIVIIPNYFEHPCMEGSQGKVVNGEKEERRLVMDMKVSYRRFYNNSISLFRTWGLVVSCECAMNPTPMLRGNMYVEFATHQEARMAVNMLIALQRKANICPKTAFQKCTQFAAGSCLRFQDCTKLHLFAVPPEKTGAAVDLPKGSVDAPAHSGGKLPASKTFEQEMSNAPIAEQVRLFKESLLKLSGRESVDDRDKKRPNEKDGNRKNTGNLDDEYFIHVTQIPRKQTKSDIYYLFGEYEGLKDVDIPEPESPDQELFSAFLIFDNQSNAEKVLSVKHTVDGKFLRLDGFDPGADATERSPSPKRRSPPRSSPPVKTSRKSRSRSSSRKSSPPRSYATRSRSPIRPFGLLRSCRHSPAPRRRSSRSSSPDYD